MAAKLNTEKAMDLHTCGGVPEVHGVGCLLADLHRGLEWNIITSTTEDGGYCIKLSSSKQDQATPRKTYGKKLMVQEPAAKPSTSKTGRDMRCDLGKASSPCKVVVDTATSQLKTGLTADQSTSRPLLSYNIDVATSRMKQEPIIPEEVPSCPCVKELINAATSRSQPRIEGVEEIPGPDMYEPEREAILIAVLTGKSMDLMDLSNVIQAKARELGITVRHNAPSH